MFHVFALDSAPTAGAKVPHMPHRHRVVVTEVHATVMGEELVDLDLVGVLGLKLLGADLDLMISDGIDLV